MNYRSLIRLLGLLVAVLGVTMLFPLGWSLYFDDGQAWVFLTSMGIAMGVGGTAWALTRGRPLEVYRREGLAVVGLGWLLSGVFGALPFMLSGVLPEFHDAFFETLSGLTTTGSTVMTDMEAAGRDAYAYGVAKLLQDVIAAGPAATDVQVQLGPFAPSVMFWRSLTHWLGGMGVIVLFLAVLPSLGAGGKQLFKSEVPGPVPEGLRPRIAETAKILWLIYVVLSCAETVALMVQGMDLYEALIHTFGTMATGGFSTRNASVAGFDSVSIDVTIIVFMVMAGSNFSLYYQVLRGKRWAMLRDPEWRTYFFITLAASAFVSWELWHTGAVAEPGQAVREASFQVVSLMTTTGYGTANFDVWPVASKVVLMTLMFVGGCAGSTGGGMKVIRVMLLGKLAWDAIRKAFAPYAVRQVRIGNAVVDEGLKTGTLAYFAILMFVMTVATFLVALTGPDIVTSITSVIATLNNIGPGLARVGAIENFAFHTAFAKYVLSFCMVLGRLELYAILVLFAPSFWRRR